MFKKDNMAFGATIGAIIPMVIYLLITEVFTKEINGEQVSRFDEGTVLVLSIVANLIPFSYFMKRPQYEKTGKGVLLVTFLFAAVYIFVKFIKEH